MCNPYHVNQLIIHEKTLTIKPNRATPVILMSMTQEEGQVETEDQSQDTLDLSHLGTAIEIPTRIPLNEEFSELVDDFNYACRCAELEDIDAVLVKLEQMKSAPSQPFTTDDKVSLTDLLARHFCDEMGTTGIHVAAANNHIQIIIRLIEFAHKIGGNELVSLWLNFVNNSGNSPLHWACMTGQIDVIRMLIHDPRVIATGLNSSGLTCFELALQSNKVPDEFLEEILSTIESQNQMADKTTTN